MVLSMHWHLERIDHRTIVQRYGEANMAGKPDADGDDRRALLWRCVFGP